MRPWTRASPFALTLAVLLSAARVVQASSILPIVIRTVQTSNISDTSATVTWLTDAAIPGSGSVVFGPSTSQVFNTVKEGLPPSGAHGDVHSVTLTNLAVGGTYYYAVSNAGVTDNNGGQYYSFKLGPTLGTPATNRTVTGVVNQPDGHTPAAGAIVTLRALDNAGLNASTGSTTSAPLSTVVGANGTWTIVLNPRTTDESQYFNYTYNGSSDFVQYSVDGGADGAIGTQTVSLNVDSSGKLAVPTVTLSSSIPTDTAVPAAPTLAPTVTPTIAPTSPPSATPSPLPPSPTVEVPPTATPVPSPTPVPTQAALAPTPAPPPPERPAASGYPPPGVTVSVPTPASVRGTDSTATPVSSAPPIAGPPVHGTPAAPRTVDRPTAVTPSPLPTLAAPRFPFVVTVTPSSEGAVTRGVAPAGAVTALARPSASATSSRVTTSGSMAQAGATSSAGNLPSQATALLVMAFGLIGLAIIVLVIGVTNRWRRE